MVIRIKRARRKLLIARWHRRIALAVCVWLVLLAISGVIINHAHDWGLDQRGVPPALQRAVYGVLVTDNEACLHEAVIGSGCTTVFAQLPVPDGTILLNSDTVFLLDGEGQLVESLSAGVLDLDSFEAAARWGDHVLLRDSSTILQADTGMLRWETLDKTDIEQPKGVSWQTRRSTHTGISWERVLLDLHAARFLGPFGQAFTDLMGALLLLLALSGIWLWWVRRKN